MLKYYEYDFGSNVIARTTTTELGNMAYQVGNNKNEVINNRRIVLNDLNVDADHFVFVHQTHSDVIKEVTSKDLGKGKDDFESGVEADALYTKEKGIALGIFHADCVPVFFYDETVPLVGVIHAGYVGTLKHVVYKSLKEVINKESINPNNIKIYIGPHRRKESYYVGEEGKEEIVSKNGVFDDGYFGSTETNINDILKAGIPSTNIKDINVDTVTTSLTYSAYKKTPVGRMTSFIILK